MKESKVMQDGVMQLQFVQHCSQKQHRLVQVEVVKPRAAASCCPTPLGSKAGEDSPGSHRHLGEAPAWCAQGPSPRSLA